MYWPSVALSGETDVNWQEGLSPASLPAFYPDSVIAKSPLASFLLGKSSGFSILVDVIIFYRQISHIGNFESIVSPENANTLSHPFVVGFFRPSPALTLRISFKSDTLIGFSLSKKKYLPVICMVKF